jgi:NADPH:quinone reductase-like Zn-dependent oxidoreductase
MMHAIRIHAYGGPEVMELEELATPIPGIGQAVIRTMRQASIFLMFRSGAANW